MKLFEHFYLVFRRVMSNVEIEKLQSLRNTNNFFARKSKIVKTYYISILMNFNFLAMV